MDGCEYAVGRVRREIVGNGWFEWVELGSGRFGWQAGKSPHRVDSRMFAVDMRKCTQQPKSGLVQSMGI